MRLKLLILRWIDDCGDGDDGNNPPVLSRLQVFEGFVEGAARGWIREIQARKRTDGRREKGREREGERDRERRAHAMKLAR